MEDKDIRFKLNGHLADPLVKLKTLGGFKTVGDTLNYLVSVYCQAAINNLQVQNQGIVYALPQQSIQHSAVQPPSPSTRKAEPAPVAGGLENSLARLKQRTGG
jgi:hypothetical protein